MIIRSYPTLSELAQYCPNLPHTVRSYPILSKFTPHCPKLPNTVQIYPTLSEVTQYCPNLPQIMTAQVILPLHKRSYEKQLIGNGRHAYDSLFHWCTLEHRPNANCTGRRKRRVKSKYQIKCHLQCYWCQMNYKY